MRLSTFTNPIRKALPSTIRGRLTLWFLILSLAPILAIGFIVYQNARSSLEKEIIDKLNGLKALRKTLWL